MPESKGKNKSKKDDKPKLSQKARELLMYAKIYRFFAFFAAFAGFVISMIIYNTMSGGEYTIFLERPAALLNIVAPFIPCSILSIIAHKKKNKFYEQALKEGVDIKALQHHPELYSDRDANKK